MKPSQTYLVTVLMMSRRDRSVKPRTVTREKKSSSPRKMQIEHHLVDGDYRLRS